MSAPAGPEAATAHLDNRFHLLAVVFQRVRQLKAGARPRIPADGHKPTRLALLEVMADTVSWRLADTPLEEESPAAKPLWSDHD